MNPAEWTDWIAALSIVLISIVGMLLTAVTLPGTWINIAGVLLIHALWKPNLIGNPWWTFGACAVIAAIAEIIEFAAGAAGAAKGGSSRAGAVAAMLGAFAGAILLSPVLFPIGTIAGGVLGAAGATILVERGIKKKSWEDSARAGKGAALGRVVATVAKTSCAITIAMIFSVAAFWN